MSEKLAAEKLPHLSSRKVAVERNDPKGFSEGPPYDVMQGTPITKDTPKQEYKAMELKPAAEKAPVSDSSAPFTLKGA